MERTQTAKRAVPPRLRYADDRELRDLERSTDLLRLALSYGYRLFDGRFPSETQRARTIRLRHRATGHAIVVVRRGTQWSYASQDDPSDRGSAVEFVLHRRGLGIGQARKELRYWAEQFATKTKGNKAALTVPGRP
jgi:hypothetical protein